MRGGEVEQNELAGGSTILDQGETMVVTALMSNPHDSIHLEIHVAVLNTQALCTIHG